MSSSTVIGSAVHFFKQYQPFSELPENELFQVCEHATLKYIPEGEWIFREHDAPDGHIYLVYKGSIALIQADQGQEVLVDLCSEGEIFGARALFAEGNYMSGSRAKEETLVYCIPASQTRYLLEKYPRVALFFATNFAATLPGRAKNFSEALKKIQQNQAHPAQASIYDETALKTVEPIRRVITCNPGLSVQEAAQMMCNYRIGSLIAVDAQRRPVGIITDADLRRKIVAKGADPGTVSVAEIMSQPVFTLPEGQTLAELTVVMMEKKIRHFCITEDGTPQSPVTGVISERDMVLVQGNNPAVLVREIRLAYQVEKLAAIRGQADGMIHQYFRQGIHINLIGKIITEINDALILKAIELATHQLQQAGEPIEQIDYCWLSLGSEGRKEQLLRTDQDNALLFQIKPGQDPAHVQQYMLQLGKAVTDILIACGFEECPGGIMASNPLWCLSLDEWVRQFQGWITEPEPKALMHATIFFDFRPVAGNMRLADELKSQIFGLIQQNQAFMTFFAKNALLNPPPLSFFRGFILEKEGKHADRFDIKARAIMPLVDAARIFAYQYQLKPYLSTSERFLEVAKQEKDHELFEEAAMAFEILLKYRAQFGLSQGNSGRYIDIGKLNQLEKQSIRNLFKIIGEIQQVLKVRYKTDFLG
jgi:CBS domain-containing protein